MSGAKAARKPLEPAILITAVTVMAYCAAFAYDVGHLQAFGLPWQLARVDLRNLMVCAGLLGLSGFLIVDGLIKMWPRNLPAPVQLLIGELVLWYGFIAFLAFNSPLRKYWPVLLLWAVGVAAYKIGMPLALHPEKATFAEKLAASIHPDSQYGVWEMVDKIAPDRRVPPLIFVGVLASVVAFGLGALLERQAGFLVDRSGGAPCAVLREHGDRLLCAEFDPATRQLNGTYRFLDLDAVLHREQTGRLSTDTIDEQDRQAARAQRAVAPATQPSVGKAAPDATAPATVPKR